MGCCPSSVKHTPRSQLIMSSLSADKGPAPKTRLRQYASEVVHFSSQYGGEGSMAYVAPNLASPPSVFPNYGDFTQACVFRTYGPWWEMVPSAPKPVGRGENFRGQDFIDLHFEEKVIPYAINVYETYHPGAVIEICAAEIERVSSDGDTVKKDNIRWHVLWSGEAQTTRQLQANMFTPTIRRIDARTNLIRLVLDHRYCQYYTELDSVELIGTVSFSDEGTDLDEVYIKHLQQLSLEDNTLNSALDVQPKTLPSTDNGFFDMLPSELIQLIFSYLDLDDLCHAAATCTLLKGYCYDQLLYAELNLQPYWRAISGDALSGLVGRCSQLQKLDLSWCGDWGKLSSNDFNGFLQQCGENLRVLRLEACRFVDRDVLATIAKVCRKLEELNLASIQKESGGYYFCLQTLTSLQRLNLYRNQISLQEIVHIIRHMPNLRHLNLGSVTHQSSSTITIDKVLEEIGKYCPNLESLDLWRARGLTPAGLLSLASSCPHLLELDVGWCAELRGNTTWLQILASNCTKLRKLFLTSIRSISDSDLLALANNLPDLEQLDVLGAQRVGPQGMARILDKCCKMRFLDVSFCQQLTVDIVSQFSERYPNVAIKKSFTTM